MDSFATIMPFASEYASAIESTSMNRPATTMGQRVRLARQKRGLTQADLAKASGLKQADVSKIENGLIQQTTAVARLAYALKCDAIWLELGVGEEPDWTKSQHSPAGARSEVNALAQDLSHAIQMMEPTTMQWESILKQELPKRFVLEIRDDAMAGLDQASLEPGHQAVFETSREPRAGRNVLVRDAVGNVYIRAYHPRTPTHWVAMAKNPAFGTLDSMADGLVILAVQTGHLY